MRPLTHWHAIAAGVLLGGLALAAAQPPAFTTELANDRVRVLRIRVEPHGTLPMHEVPPHVLVWLTDGQLRLLYPDGRTEDQSVKAGEVAWVSVGKHAGRNLGDKAIEFVAVEPIGTPRH
jgi:quercetin dioxygenase-like cupin family protein